MKAFNRTAYEKELNVDFIDNPSIKYQRRMSSNRPHNNPVPKRGFSGLHEPEPLSINKSKDPNHLYGGSMYPAKPILSSFRKKEERPLKLNFVNPKTPFRQTAADFMSSKGKEKAEERFYETAVNGFGLHNRPMSKQQPRKNKPGIKDADLEQISFDEDDADSNIEDMDEEDREMILNFHNLNVNSEVVVREDRPQTSKGFRKKMPSSSDLEVSVGESLFEEMKNPLKKKIEGCSNIEEMKIPIKNMYYDRNGHPTSAHPKNQNKGSKQLDEMIRLNPTSKKNSIDNSAPFESLIGTEFLSLFANRKS